MPVSTESGRSVYEAARLHLARLRVGGGASLRPAFQEAAKLAAETLGVDRVSVWLFVEKRTAIRCFELYERARNEHSEGFMLHRDAYPAYFAALEERRAIAAVDARTDPATSDFRASYLEPLDIHSMLDAPIFQGGEVGGRQRNTVSSSRGELHQVVLAGLKNEIVEWGNLPVRERSRGVLH